MQEPYRQVILQGKWRAMEEFFNSDEGFTISYPIMTVAKDTAFHIAVHSKSEQPLKQLLDLFAKYDEQIFLTNVLNTTNAYNNTVLHEAAINHNIVAVKLLVEDGHVTPAQLLVRNNSGQTPLFKAAAFGSTKVVKYLASQPDQMIASVRGYKKFKYAHRINYKDGCSILHAAVLGENFGTALELLKLDKELAYVQNKKGMTSLHLLTNLQSAFTDKYSNHLWHRLLYFCIPTGTDYYDDANNYDDDDDEVGDNQTMKNALPQSTIRGKGY
ncbi:hypothetical protein Q3G72_000234 [Acer saccharum]|nr:hypothetical protein Q3G72_000234 [Acer saccharum]